jgi:hypothetical protein
LCTHAGGSFVKLLADTLPFLLGEPSKRFCNAVGWPDSRGNPDIGGQGTETIARRYWVKRKSCQDTQCRLMAMTAPPRVPLRSSIRIDLSRRVVCIGACMPNRGSATVTAVTVT